MNIPMNLLMVNSDSMKCVSPNAGDFFTRTPMNPTPGSFLGNMNQWNDPLFDPKPSCYDSIVGGLKSAIEKNIKSRDQN